MNYGHQGFYKKPLMEPLIKPLEETLQMAKIQYTHGSCTPKCALWVHILKTLLERVSMGPFALRNRIIMGVHPIKKKCATKHLILAIYGGSL